MNEQLSQKARSASFQQLKPICVKLSQIALQQEVRGTKELTTALEALLGTARNVPVLDAKLADYAFFPISYVIRDAASIPAGSLSIAVQCLQVFIERGWRNEADPSLMKELLMFLTIQLSKKQQDDLLLALLTCADTLFRCVPQEISELCTGKEKQNSALTGQLMDNLLTIAKDSPAIEVQVTAITTLKDLVSILTDCSLLRSFLPGLVSQLANVLRPQSRRTYRVLVAALSILKKLILATLSDSRIDKETTDEDRSWRRTTSEQLLVAMSTFLPLRYHERSEVLDAMGALCITILDDCGMTLENCQSTMLETLCIIASQSNQSAEAALERLTINTTIGSSLRELFFKWLQSLSRKLESQDSQAAERHVALISAGHQILKKSGMDTRDLEREMQRVISDTARSLFMTSKKTNHVDQLPDVTVHDLTIARSFADLKAPDLFRSPQLGLLEKLLSIAQDSSNGDFEVQEMDSSSLASLWMLTRNLHYQIEAGQAFQDLVIEAEVSVQMLETALNSALNVLGDNTGGQDYRAQVLALELLTLVAQQEKEEFQTSLVDTLFPIVELLGAPNSVLKQSAIVALDRISRYSGYTGAGDMIVRNVDYLVNAIALQFNSFNVSPQAGQVLVMMLELSGPSLIPYLDDLVDSIFGALAAYHGYPRLVEVMFAALSSIVKHGSSNSSSTMNSPSIIHKKQKPVLTQVIDIPDILERIRNPVREEPEDIDMNESSTEDPGTALQTTETSKEVAKPPKVYTMVESVVRLSQYYLTHQEPYLRQRLLELVATGCTSLSRNEEQFLPLINDIWPVVIRRLFDEEAIVILAATKALIAIFQAAGDFVSTRIQDEWPRIKSFFYSCQAKAVAERKGSGGRGMFAYTERIFEAITDTLVQMILHVRVTHEMEDDLFAMLGPMARSNNDVRDALDLLNPDMLWLILEAKAWRTDTPVMEGFVFVNIKSIAS